MTQKQKDTYDRVLLTVVAIIAGFIFFSMVAQFVLVFTGRLGTDDAGVFRPLFDLIVVLVGAVGGYVAGERVERARGSEPEPPEELEGWEDRP